MQPTLPFDDREIASKRCAGCREVKPVTEFHRHRRKPDGRQRLCRVCNIEQAKKYHADHLEACRERIRVRWNKIRTANRARLLAYLLEHSCVDCGESDPIVLEFDHLRDKVLNVSELANRAVPWKKIADEIAKCEVVCANCHRRRTCTRADSYRVRANEHEIGVPSG